MEKILFSCLLVVYSNCVGIRGLNVSSVSQPDLNRSFVLTSVDLSRRGIMDSSFVWNTSNGILFSGLFGLSLRMNKEFLEMYDQVGQIIFMQNRFDLYDEHDHLIGADECSAANFEHRDIRFFGNLGSVVVEMKLNSVILERPICPYVFKNANIIHLILTNFGHSYFSNNVPTFYQIKTDPNITVNLNINLSGLRLSKVYRLKLTKKSLNELVFANISQLYIDGILTEIETDFFRTFQSLMGIYISLDNTESFSNPRITSGWIKFSLNIKDVQK